MLMTAPTEDLIRMADRIELREEQEGLGTLFGHFAVFNSWTEIDSWEGKFRERISPGAFRKTFREQRDAIQVLLNHGYDPQVGDKPLGRASVLKEDDTGAYAEVPLDDTSYNRDIAASLRSGALRGQSFRFRVMKEEWDEEGEIGMPERTIKEIRLFEFGPVTFPAYLATTAGVRNREDFAVWRGLTEAQRREVLAMTRRAATLNGAGGPPAEPPSTRPNLRATLRLGVIRHELSRRGLA